MPLGAQSTVSSIASAGTHSEEFLKAAGKLYLAWLWWDNWNNLQVWYLGTPESLRTNWMHFHVDVRYTTRELEWFSSELSGGDKNRENSDFDVVQMDTGPVPIDF